jgi:predicted transcriptional regulator
LHISTTKHNGAQLIPANAPQELVGTLWIWYGVSCVDVSTSKSTVMKTIQMTIDERLLKVVDKITRARKTTRSAFIRDALEAEIRRQRIRENEIRHAEGYAQQPVALGEFDIWLREQDWGTP